MKGMAMKKKTTKRADGIKVSSIAIHADILEEVGRIAAENIRSRNNMIEYFLRQAVKNYNESKKG